VTLDDETAAVDRWIAADLAAAVLPADRTFVVESAGVRALVVRLVRDPAAGDELFDACAVLGGLVAAHGGSPTLASATFEHLLQTLDLRAPPWASPARAAVAEGFARAILDQALRESMAAWEFPHCSVPLEEDAVAVAATHPSRDLETVNEWAARVAQSAALRGIRRAIVSGRDAQSIVDAMAIVGIRAVIA
jgi:hypothetical protein